MGERREGGGREEGEGWRGKQRKRGGRIWKEREGKGRGEGRERKREGLVDKTKKGVDERCYIHVYMYIRYT